MCRVYIVSFFYIVIAEICPQSIRLTRPAAEAGVLLRVWIEASRADRRLMHTYISQMRVLELDEPSCWWTTHRML